LLNAAAVPEAEPEIVCAVRVALPGGAPIEVHGKRAILCARTPRSRQIPKLFCAAAFPISADMRKCLRIPAVLQASPIIVEPIAALEAAAEAVYAIGIVELGRRTDALGSSSEIDRNPAARLETPAKANSAPWCAILAAPIKADCSETIKRMK
jgi:hypothetical protein